MKFLLLCTLLFLSISLSMSEENACDNSDVSMESTLHRKLLCKYDRDNRPVKDHNNPVNVTLRMFLKFIQYSHQFQSIETITINSWIPLRWKDEYLQWKPDEYGGLNETIIHSSKIWIPDLSLYNSPTNQGSGFNYPCQVSSTGTVICIPQITHVAICNMNYKNWPHDRQNCTLTFGTWMHKGEQVNYYLPKNPVNIDDYRQNKYWKLISVDYSRNPGKYNCCANVTYPTVKFSFTIERYKLLLMTKILIPCLAMAVMTVVSLALNIESFERIALMFFNVYFHFYYTSSMDYWLPGSADDIPYLLVYYKHTIVIAIVVLFEGVILKNMVQYTTVTPQWATRVIGLMNTPAGKIVFHEFDPTSDTNTAVDDTENLTSNSENVAPNIEWRKLALFVNRLFSLIIILTYLILIFMYLT